jgi:hypothetical protein
VSTEAGNLKAYKVDPLPLWILMKPSEKKQNVASQMRKLKPGVRK